VKSKLRALDVMKGNLISQIDLAYTMELMQIPAVSAVSPWRIHVFCNLHYVKCYSICHVVSELLQLILNWVS